MIDIYDIRQAFLEMNEETKKFVLSQPEIDAVPVMHGRWYWAEDGHCKCSMCGQYATIKRTVVKTNFCPNCGSKMDGGQMER